jgi:hypothetical protein
MKEYNRIMHFIKNYQPIDIKEIKFTGRCDSTPGAIPCTAYGLRDVPAWRANENARLGTTTLTASAFAARPISTPSCE